VLFRSDGDGDDARADEAPLETTADATVGDETATADDDATATADPVGFVFDGFSLTGWAAGMLDAAQSGAIDAVLPQATGNRVQSIDELLQALSHAETALTTLAQQIVHNEGQKRALDAGEITANEVEVAQPTTFKVSNLAGIDVGGPMKVAVDQLLAGATGQRIHQLDSLVDALKDTEQRVVDGARRARESMRDLKRALPRESKAAVAVGEESAQVSADIDSLEFEVVERLASEIFTDAFGSSSPVLDFYIPTLEWVGTRHPDVPEVDESYRFYAPLLADALDCIAENRIPYVFGDSGSGKSELFEQVAARIGFPLIRVNLDTGVTRSDLVGRTALVPGEGGFPTTRFVAGIITRALSQPCILLLDEMDCGDPEIFPILQPVLEGRGLRLLEDGGHYVRPHPLCRIGATANTVGLGSENMAYTNVQELSAATRNRVARWLEMPYLPEDKEIEVVLARFPGADQSFVENTVRFANKAREAYRMGNISQIVSTRQVLEAARRYARFRPLIDDDVETRESTLKAVVLNSADPSSAATLRGLIDAIFD